MLQLPWRNYYREKLFRDYPSFIEVGAVMEILETTYKNLLYNIQLYNC